VATTGETISRLLMWRLMSVSSTSTVLSMPPPQQPALQLIYDTAPIDLGLKVVRSIIETGEPVTGIEVPAQRADQTEEGHLLASAAQSNPRNCRCQRCG